MWLFGVPNVPCGVESNSATICFAVCLSVPNVPCGVESFMQECRLNADDAFLMYRVELKVFDLRDKRLLGYEFLMYRVELKVMIALFMLFSLLCS